MLNCPAFVERLCVKENIENFLLCFINRKSPIDVFLKNVLGMLGEGMVVRFRFTAAKLTSNLSILKTGKFDLMPKESVSTSLELTENHRSL